MGELGNFLMALGVVSLIAASLVYRAYAVLKELATNPMVDMGDVPLLDFFNPFLWLLLLLACIFFPPRYR